MQFHPIAEWFPDLRVKLHFEIGASHHHSWRFEHRKILQELVTSAFQLFDPPTVFDVRCVAKFFELAENQHTWCLGGKLAKPVQLP